MTSTVALTGATGALGGRVATRLAATAQEDDAALWVLVRDAGARG
jgi:thioester reductase-like protein